MNTKTMSYFSLRALALVIGLVFPFVTALWKIIILIAFLLFRVIDIEKEKAIFGATPLFFIGMLIAFTYKLLWS